MPVLEVDGQKIPQSMTIARFVAKQFNLAGKNNLEQAKVDSVIDTIGDLMQIFLNVFFHEKDESKKEEGKKQLFKDDVPKSFANLEKLLTTYGENGPFFLGNQLTYADIQFYDAVAVLLRMDATILNNYPKLKLNYSEVEKQPKIAAYVKSRPQTQS